MQYDHLKFKSTQTNWILEIFAPKLSFILCPQKLLAKYCYRGDIGLIMKLINVPSPVAAYDQIKNPFVYCI